MLDVPEFGEGAQEKNATPAVGAPQAAAQIDNVDFQLWRLLKERALAKLQALHRTVRYGRFLGSKVKLPIDKTRPMELDFIGTHEDGLFVLELKVDRAAERHAFSELLAYSNYIADLFALSGHKDIANVLVAKLDNKITRQAYLYDLLIADRNIIVYKPSFDGSTLESLTLKAELPTDEDFRTFTNDLLSHNAMACAVASFHDLPDWFDSEENDGSLNDFTVEHLSRLSSYAAQLMETERLHGFCFVRKPWKEIPLMYRNSLIVCAVNPFRMVRADRFEEISDQIGHEHVNELIEFPQMAFDGRVIRLAKRAVEDCLEHGQKCQLEVPYWGTMVTSMQEVVMTHNFAFHPTGILREAYVSYLNDVYRLNAAGRSDEDVSRLKVNEITNWLGAWQFMEACGFVSELAEPGDFEDQEA